jgi:hypothetical protein
MIFTVMKNRNRLRDFAIYVAAGMAVVAVAFVWAIYFPDVEVESKWIGFVGTTAFVFGYTIKNGRQYWRNKAFWGAVAGLLLAHTIIGSIILRMVFTRVGTAFFILPGAFELLILSVAAQSAARKNRHIPDRPTAD